MEQLKKLTGDAITVKYNNGKTVVHKLRKFKRTNGGTCINQRPIVKKGEIVKKVMPLQMDHQQKMEKCH